MLFNLPELQAAGGFSTLGTKQRIAEKNYNIKRTAIPPGVSFKKKETATVTPQGGTENEGEQTQSNLPAAPQNANGAETLWGTEDFPWAKDTETRSGGTTALGGRKTTSIWGEPAPSWGETATTLEADPATSFWGEPATSPGTAVPSWDNEADGMADSSVTKGAAQDDGFAQVNDEMHAR